MEYDILEGAEACGATASREPPTATLIGEGYTPYQCILKWPADPTIAQRATANEILALQGMLRNCAEPDRPGLELLITQKEKLLPKVKKGLRIDVSMLFNNNKEVWIDVSGIHLTGKTRLNKCYTFYKAEVLQERFLTLNNGVIPNYKETSTPAVSKAQTVKHQKYAPMLATARSYFDRKRRSTRPDFFGCIASHEGEWSSDVVSMFEIMAMARYSQVRNGLRRRDGLVPSAASAQLRAMLRDRFAITLAKGWGKQLRASGFPRCVDDKSMIPNDDGFY